MPGLVATVGTSGEKEFRQAIAQITREVKTSAAEMKVLTERYKGNEQSQEALTEQARVLSRTIEAQERQVEEMDRAYKNAVNIYGETSKEALSWQKRLYDTTAELERNQRQLRETDEALAKSADAMDDLGDESETAGRKVKESGDNAAKGSEGWAKLGNIAKAAGKALAAAGAAAAAGVVAISKASLEGYAEYEQLVGGVDTLFRDAADDVKRYAADAYQTAGMTANEYMANVTSFSAAMIASLGDTQLAAEASNQAITDMADNANKMGTSLDSVVETYQSLAKGNFQVLDNLKLGYGGTRAEMQRMIDDANKVKEANGETADLSIESFADMTEAIHIIQSEMGITGATAAEASTTIQGSVASMKSAWQNLVVGLADENADFDQLLDNFIDSVQTAASNIIPRLKVILQGTMTFVEKLAPQFIDIVVPMAGDILNSLGDAIVKNLPTLTSKAFTVISQLARAFLKNIGKLATVGIQIITTLVNGIAQELPTLVPLAVTALLDLVTALTDNIGLLTDSAVLLVDGLIDGIEAAMPLLMDQAPVIIEKLVLAFSENAPKLIEAAGRLMTVLALSLSDNAPLLVEQIPTILKAFAIGFVSYQSALIDVGASLMGSIWDGIKGAAERYWVMLKHWLQGVVSAIQNLFANGFTSANLQNSLNMANPFNYMSIPRTLAGAEAGVYVPNRRTVYEGNVTLDGDAVGRFAVNAVTKELYAQ